MIYAGTSEVTEGC